MASTVPAMTEIGTDWRVLDGAATAWFDAPSLIEGAALAGRIVELSGAIAVDLRATGMRVRLDSDEHAAAVSAAARDLGLAANPAVLQQVSVVFESANPAVVRRFWQRVLDYAPGDDGGLADPLRRDPALRVRYSAEVRPLRNRIHLDVVRPAAAVEQADLGEPFGPFGVCHTDPDGNEVDLVPGDALGETTGTADWQAVFSAMACYRTTSPTQQRDLAAAAAALADDTGFPLLVDLRPGLVIFDSGKDQWEADAHGLELDFTDLAGDLQTAARELGATADPGLPRLRPALPRRCRRHRSPRSGSPPSATPPTGEPGSSTSTIRDVWTRSWCSKSSTRRRRSGAGSATASTSSSPCRRTRASSASPRPSQPVAGSSTSRRIAGASPTLKATKW